MIKKKAIVWSNMTTILILLALFIVVLILILTFTKGGSSLTHGFFKILRFGG